MSTPARCRWKIWKWVLLYVEESRKWCSKFWPLKFDNFWHECSWTAVSQTVQTLPLRIPAIHPEIIPSITPSIIQSIIQSAPPSVFAHGSALLIKARSPTLNSNPSSVAHRSHTRKSQGTTRRYTPSTCDWYSFRVIVPNAMCRKHHKYRMQCLVRTLRIKQLQLYPPLSRTTGKPARYK